MDAVEASGGTLGAGARAPELLSALQWQGLRRISQVNFATKNVSFSLRKNMASWEIPELNGGILIWVNYNDLTVLPHWKSWLDCGKLSPNGHKIQGNEIL